MPDLAGGPVPPETIARIFRRIDALRDDLVALTQRLIRFPTINPPG